VKKLLKQLELERRLEAGLTKEDSAWLDKLERLMKKAPDGISQRVEAFTVGDNYIGITPLFDGEMIKKEDHIGMVDRLDVYCYEIFMPFPVHSTSA
jgi:hypothetical protein